MTTRAEYEAQKLPTFLPLPMRDMPISQVPGITPECEEELAKIECTLATQLLARLLLLKDDKACYIQWFLFNVRVPNAHIYASLSYYSLTEWTKLHF